jgi:hypothetical protein
MSVPSIADQRRAIGMFKSLSTIQSLQFETGIELEAMVSAILDGAFKGKL